MLKLSTSTTPPSVQRAMEILTYNNKKMGGIPLDYDRLCEYWSYHSYMKNQYHRKICSALGRNPADKLTDAMFINVMESANVPLDMFKATKGGGVSLSQPSIEAALETNVLSKEWATIVGLYGKRNMHGQIASSIGNLVSKYPISNIQTYDHHRMIFAKPTWAPQNTGRFAMQDPAIMNFAKIILDVHTVPGGWLFYKVDSGQIDPRIGQSNYIKDEQLKRCTMLYNDAYYGYLHYCKNLSQEQIMRGDLNFIAMPITSDMEKGRKEVKRIGNGVLYGKTTNPDRDPFIDTMIERVGNHPNRIRWQREIENNIERGNYIVHTAFGTPIDITKGPSDKNYPDKRSDAYIRHLISTAFADTIQGTAADLHRMAVESANNVLTKEAPNSVILESVHDALVYAIFEKDLPHVEDYVKDSVSYQVDDWIPIYSDCTIGIEQSGELERLIK